LLYFSPTIISFVQNPSSSTSYNAPFTSLTLRDGTHGTNHTATLDFGDTEYNFEYSMGGFTVSTFIESGYKPYSPHDGDVYKVWGIEIDVSNVATDYISNYIVFLAKPTVQNYMASLHYTEVNITLNNDVAVNISSGLTNETHQYDFMYVLRYKVGAVESTNLEIQTDGNRTDVTVAVGFIGPIAIDVLNVEIATFRLEPQYMVIYVKPLY